MNISQLTKPSRILIEQDSDPTLLNFKREMLGLPFEEQILFNDARYMHYSSNKKRIIIKDDILCRQYYNDLGEVSHLRVLLPKQLLKVLLQSLHGTARKHPGISKMMHEIRQKYYFPSIAAYSVTGSVIAKYAFKKHAITKHAQTIGVLERAHATIEISLKMASGDHRKQWHKYLPIAILNYNRTYQSSVHCEPSRVFHGRVPHNIPHHKLCLRFNPNIAPTTDFAVELLR